MFIVLFFKQKTAYGLRISDWSSDVCSSDLGTKGLGAGAGDDDAADRVAVVARRHRRDDRFRHFGGRGVALVGAVEGDRRDGTVDGETHGVGHGVRLRTQADWWRSCRGALGAPAPRPSDRSSRLAVTRRAF